MGGGGGWWHVERKRIGSSGLDDEGALESETAFAYQKEERKSFLGCLCLIS